MQLRNRRLVFSLSIYAVLLVTLVTFLELASAKPDGNQTAAWTLNLAAESQAKSTITIRNQCRQTHSFTMVPNQVPYLQLPATPTVQVPGQTSQAVGVVFNTAGVKPGDYRGSVAVKCETCAEERGCSQENEIVPIHLTVSPNNLNTNFGTTLPTPTPIEEQPSCNNDKCKVKEIILNTGYDQLAGSPYAPVQPDGYWELVNAPNPNLSLPSPAWVINANAGWQTLPNSHWISPYNNSAWLSDNPAPEQPYSLQRCFCTCEGIKSLDINLQMLVDNVADVYFDGVLIGSQTDQTTGSFIHPFKIEKHVEVKPGKHCLRIDVRNLSGIAMGLDVTGTITSPNPTGASLFLSAACCNPIGKIIGRKIKDENCNGKNDNEPGLQGWTITATNTSTGVTVTTVTDASGFYYFNNLPPGTYTISEVNLTGWTQSMPGGSGNYTVTLAGGQVIQRDFANCKKKDEPKECALVVPRAAECKADGSGGYNYSFSVTNNTGSDVTQILLTPPSGSGLVLSDQTIVLTTPLHNGGSITIPVSIGNVKPGTKPCFFVTLMTKDGPCCTVEVCPILPDCCAIATGKFECDLKGTYTGTFTIVNTSPNTIKNIYLYPPAGVTMSKTYFAVSLAPGQSFTTPLVTIKGAKPGRFCFRISMHTEDMKDCCSVDVCIVLPECGFHIGAARTRLNPAGALEAYYSRWGMLRRRVS